MFFSPRYKSAKNLLIGNYNNKLSHRKNGTDKHYPGAIFFQGYLPLRWTLYCISFSFYFPY